MLKSSDDLFACGVHEPCSSATVCEVVGIDDLIILGVVVAASIAASQVSASEQESAGKEQLSFQQNQARKQQQINFYKQQQDQAAANTRARYGAGGVSQAAALQPIVDNQMINAGYDQGMKQVERGADATRAQGWMNAGTALAGGVARASMRPASSPGLDPGAGYDGTGADIGQRAGGYDLNAASSGLLSNSAPVSTPQIHSMDPMGGYQLQPDDYGLLMGDSNPYTNADPNRYRFGIL